jgi:hypothetical protein
VKELLKIALITGGIYLLSSGIHEFFFVFLGMSPATFVMFVLGLCLLAKPSGNSH